MRWNNLLWIPAFYCFLSLAASSAWAEGSRIYGKWEHNPGIAFGLLEGEQRVSQIQPSPYGLVSYGTSARSENIAAAVNAGFSQAFIKTKDWHNLTTISETASLSGTLPFSPAFGLSAGIMQNTFLSAYWDPALEAFWRFGGLDLEFLPGLVLFANPEPNIKILAGAGSRLILGPEDIRNLNFHRYRFLELGSYFWLKWAIPDWPKMELSFKPEIGRQTYQAGCEYSMPAVGVLTAGLAWEVSQNALFPDQRSATAGCRLALNPVELQISLAYAKRKYAGESTFQDELTSCFQVNVLLGNESLGLVVSDQRKIMSPDKFYADSSGEYYADPDSRDFNDIRANLIEQIMKMTYDEFIQYVQANVRTQKQIRLLSEVLGGYLYVYNYGTGQELESSFYTDTTANTAGNKEIYVALQNAIWSEKEAPFTFCQGISQFINDLVTAANVEGVEAYSSLVSYQGVPHIISLFTMPDQIYLNDYDTIIPTHTRDIETALQVYENLYSLPLAEHFVFDKNGHLLAAVKTPDGKLLQEALTVQKDRTWHEQLQQWLEQGGKTLNHYSHLSSCPSW